ncbi:MAG: hypothetical protein HY318_11595 [Armatimonadetes bacterium]|nr:hypothetical protein [Armatimonadota bacterium]
MVYRIVTALVTLSLFRAGVALADPNIYGQTGLALNPTAYMPNKDEVKARATYLKQDVAGISGNWFTFAGGGLTSDKMELSLGYVTLGTNPIEEDGFTAGLKLRIKSESETSPAVAVGANWLGPLDQGTAYCVLSRSLGPKGEQESEGASRRIHGHLGARWDDYSKGGTPLNGSRLGGFLGLDAALSQRISLESEVGTTHKVQARTPWSAMLKFKPTEKLSISAGALQTGFSDSTQFVVSVGFTFPRTEMK